MELKEIGVYDDEATGLRGVRRLALTYADAEARRRCIQWMTDVGKDRVDVGADPVMASEDFGVLAQQVPACLAFLGNGSNGPGDIPLHSHDYAFNDDILVAGVAYYTHVVRDSLAGQPTTA